MDIIITMPDIEKEGIDNLIKHYSELIYYRVSELIYYRVSELIYYRVSRLPTDLKIGEKCYIVSNGNIIGFHLVKELRFVSQEEADNLSDGIWREGFYIIREAKTFQKLIPYINATGFQGFRYFNKFVKRWKR